LASLHAQTTVVSINAGGAATGAWAADEDYAGGTAADTAAAINTSQVSNPAPQAVYQYERYGDFTYTIPNLTAGASYTVNLSFAEIYWTAAGKREFNVLINGTQVLTNFDIFATAGGEDIAIVKSFAATASSTGTITIQFTTGAADNPKISGIQIVTAAATTTEGPYPGPAAAAVPGTVLAENYDTGGQGVAYNVTATNGTDNGYRSQGVDLETATAPATGNDLGWTAAGQWFKYTVNVSTAGTYTVSFLVASPTAVADAFHLSNSSGTNLSGSVAVPATGGYQDWVTVTASVTLPAGTQTLTLNEDNAGWNIDSMAFAAPVSSCTAAPSAPTGLASSGTTSSGTTLNWTADTAPANCSISGYTVLKNGASIGTATGTSFAVTGLAASTNYSFTVEATDAAGTSSASSAVSVTTAAASGGGDILDINAGGAAAGSYVADEDFSGGTASASTATVNTASVTNPAPQAVYLTQRYGNFTYTLPGFTAGATYTVRLHFAETYWTAAGEREFNVLINGTQVLTDFDMFATAGGENIAVAEQFSAVANSSGQIVIQFVTVKDNAAVNGIEIESGSGGTAPSAPAPPTGLTATAASSSEINLSWTASTTAGAAYNVFQDGSQIASVSGTTYASTGLAASTTYSYTVEATNSAGTSAADGPVSATTLAGQTGATAPPTSLTAVGSSSQQIDLRWVASTTSAPNTAPVNYLVYRSTTANFTPSSANLMGTTIGITNYLDSNYPATLSPSAGPGVQPSTTYYYQVVASTPSGTSTAATASATSLPTTPSTAAPAALTGLTALAETANEIDLIWNSTNSGVGTVVTTYYIYRSTTATFTPATSNQIGTTKSNWFQDELVSASTRYYYQVLANSSLGVSPSSSTVSAVTPALNPNLWGGAPFFDGSGIPAKPAGDTLMVKFLNRTNGKYTDSQITYTATINGSTVNTSIAANPTYAMGANSAGRMYFFLNDPTANEDNTDYWDFIEFTVGATSINMDTTRVDAFGVKIAFNLTCSDGTNVALGENQETFMEDRSVTFQRYTNAAPSTPGGDFQADLVYAPYRIIEPGAAGFNAGGADQNYYANYISDIWSFNGITIAEAGPNGSGLPSNPDLSAAIFRHTAPISGTPEFNAAGDLTNQGMWGNPASFYQQEPYDHYAQWIEAQAVNMQQYAFPYNDAGGYSSDIGCSNPNTLLVAIGW
jgi:chitodextrinase